MSRLRTTFMVRTGTLILLTIVIVGYSLITAHNYITGPIITITEPIPGSTVTSSILVLRGIAKNIKALELNGLSIVMDDKGNFGQYNLLYPGFNRITLVGHDRFGRTINNNLEIIYTPTTTDTLPQE